MRMKPPSKDKDKGKVNNRKGKASSKRDMAMMATLLDQLKNWKVNSGDDKEENETTPGRKRGRKPKQKEVEHGIMLTLKAIIPQ